MIETFGISFMAFTGLNTLLGFERINAIIGGVVGAIVYCLLSLG